MSDGGYFLVHRKLFENELLKGRPDYMFAWIWMLSQARYADNCEVRRGQLICSSRYLAKMTGLSHKAARIFLSKLGAHKMIEVGTPRGTQASVVTICNYLAYQAPPVPRGTPRGTVKPKKGHNSKERVEIKEDNVRFEEWWLKWRTCAGKLEKAIGKPLNYGTKQDAMKAWNRLSIADRQAAGYGMPKYYQRKDDCKEKCHHGSTYLKGGHWNV